MHMPSAPDEIIRAGARKFTREQKPGQVPEISDVWSGKYQMAAWLEYPVDLLKGSQRVRQMLYHFKADYGVKITILPRQRPSGVTGNSFHAALLCLVNGFRRDINSINMFKFSAYTCIETSVPAAYVKQS